jgi:hypothetical protein
LALDFGASVWFAAKLVSLGDHGKTAMQKIRWADTYLYIHLHLEIDIQQLVQCL